MSKCLNCGFEKDGEFAFCPVCGEKRGEPIAAPINETANVTEPAEQPEQQPIAEPAPVQQVEQPVYAQPPAEPPVVYAPPTYAEPANPAPKKKSAAGLIIGIVVLVLALAAAAVFFLFPMIKGRLAQSEVATLSDDQLESQAVELDYMLISQFFETCGVGDTYSYICDADDDGKDELFIVFDTFSYEIDGVYYYKVFCAFDPDYKDKCHIISYLDYIDTEGGGVDYVIDRNPEEYTQLRLSDKYGVLLTVGEAGYAVDSYETYHYKWTNDGWTEVLSNLALRKNYTAETEQEYSDSYSELGVSQMTENSSENNSLYFDAKNASNFYDYYINRIKDNNNILKSENDDFDGDGNNEQMLILNARCFEDLIENAVYEGEKDMKTIISILYEYNEMESMVALYFDSSDTAVLINLLNLDCNYFNDDYEIIHSDNIIGVRCNDSGFGTVCIAVDSVENYSESYGSGSARERLADGYFASLSESGFTDISYKMVDLAPTEGDEMIVVARENNSNRYDFYVCAFYKGRACVIYSSVGESYGSHYIYIDDYDSPCILYYRQETTTKKITYAYRLISFDKDLAVVYGDENSLTLKLNETPDAYANEFLSAFNNMLKSSYVCVDPYELTGYGTMTGGSHFGGYDNDESDYPSEYLSINNCDTSKSGIVDVSEGWLNFRSGPSKKNKVILLDPSDKQSYVRQLRGSVVTVLDTVNTGDKKNPIWVKIQIKYADMTLVGYSSQRYIDLYGIRHISVGDKFDINADSSSNNLYWSVNDTSVATIDSKTGKITGKAAGLVMVTVSDDNGLTDSCLVMID